MDLEASFRRDLIHGLGSSFLCFEEVELEHAVLPGVSVRADVIAIPIDQAFWRHALAFEVKSYNETAEYARWSAAIRQASDYVYGMIRSDNHILHGRRVSASMIYPSPDYLPYLPRQDVPPDISNRIMIAGAFHCAMHSRVGRAHKSAKEGLSLIFGPNEFWTAKRGFTTQATNLLQNKRPVGSRKIDVSTVLNGLDAVMPDFE